jgi:hypothetical protein
MGECSPKIGRTFLVGKKRTGTSVLNDKGSGISFGSGIFKGD